MIIYSICLLLLFSYLIQHLSQRLMIRNNHR